MSSRPITKSTNHIGTIISEIVSHQPTPLGVGSAVMEPARMKPILIEFVLR